MITAQNSVEVLYIGTALDRLARFASYLGQHDAHDIFNTLERTSAGVGEQPAFQLRLRECLIQLCRILKTVVDQAGSMSSTQSSVDGRMLRVRHCFILLDKLHRNVLTHLPRPTEPVELRRFLRLLERHVLRVDEGNVAVYMSEDTTETAFQRDPVAETYGEIEGILDVADLEKAGISGEGARGIHVTIGRVDARNPLRWPVLVHEAAHNLLSLYVPEGIKSRFDGWLTPELATVAGFADVDLSAWLQEIWCDLFAASVLGPAFLYSQYHAFAGDASLNYSGTQKYPPFHLRLRLIQDALRHLYPNVAGAVLAADDFREALRVVDYWDHHINTADHLLESTATRQSYLILREFFLDHFYGGARTEAENFRSAFEKMVRYVRDLDPARINELRITLSQGRPAPSKPDKTNIPFLEEPTSLQEILFGAGVSHFRDLMPRLIKLVHDTNHPEQLLELLAEAVDRQDSAVLRSVQISEWLDVLCPSSPPDIAASSGEVRVITPAEAQFSAPLLCDREIRQLLERKELVVVPLVNIDQQLGSTSLDVRLGTSFEVYYPIYVARSRAGSHSDSSVRDDTRSRSIDLDFLESINLLPGQLVLAHSFEYVRLPENLAADLEGRSSYARLGLEIHMTAGMIDPGFEGVITFEIKNNGPNAIQLIPGTRIAQLRFLRVATPDRPYSRKHTAKYKGLLRQRPSMFQADTDYRRLLEARTRESTNRQPN